MRSSPNALSGARVSPGARARFLFREVCPQVAMGNASVKRRRRKTLPLAIAGTGYGVIGLLVIVLLVVLIVYFARRA
jgi:hypothetical protein